MWLRKWLLPFSIALVFILVLLHMHKQVHAVSPAATKLQQLINPPSNGEPNQWLGADAATSIKIDDERYIWLFGDTILGTSNFPSRDPLPATAGGFIHNSVGVSEYHHGHWSPIVKYFKPGYKAIFSPAANNQYYWVLAGHMIHHKLFLVACRLQSPQRMTAPFYLSPRTLFTSKSKPPVMTILGTTFLLVANPQDPPDQWQVEKSWDVSDTNAALNWYSAVVRQGSYLYIFGEQGSGLFAQTILSRMKLADVADCNWQQREYFTGSGQWSATASPVALAGLPGTSEMSIIRRHHRWYTLQISWNPLKRYPHFIKYTVTPYTAAELDGPWKKQTDIYTVPAPWNTAMQQGVNTYAAYAPKLHPELAEHGELVFTYNTNVNALGLKRHATKIFYNKLRSNQGLYIPQFVVQGS